MQVASEIRRQIGNEALIMMGARHIAADANGLSFRIGRNPKGVTHVVVTLDPSDTYTVTFFRVRSTRVDEIARVSDVYVDSLHATLREHTGLETSL